ncbi:MAG: signal peptidase I [Clostridia bacterium]|nr:signal peptidase I [Clostridia bacterium]
MESFEIIALLVTGVGVVSFATIFTILYLSYANSSVAEYQAGQRDVELIEETIYNNINSKKVRIRVARRVKQVLFYVAVSVLVPLLVLSLFTKLTTGVAMIGGRGVIVVASGSMSEKNPHNPNLGAISRYDNQFNTYDLIVLEKVNSPRELQLYDVIAYTNDEGVNIIHRIVAKEGSGDSLRYVTCGDANNANDKYKPSFDDVIGRYTEERVPVVGVFVMFLQSYSGIVTLVAIIYCLIMIEYVSEKIYKAQRSRHAILEASIDFVREMTFDRSLQTRFVETVRFKDHEYVFDENGFVSKTPVNNNTTDDGDI